MFAPAVGFMGEDFGITSQILLSFTVRVYLLGYVVRYPFLPTNHQLDLTPGIQFGPLFLAPLSEIYGRRVVLSGANALFVLWQIGCALAPNVKSLIIFRPLAGIGGSGCVTLGAGVIADLFVVEERGLASSIWSLGPLIGPVVGPICGGFVGKSSFRSFLHMVVINMSTPAGIHFRVLL